MFAASPSFDYMASLSSDTPVYPKQDTLVSSRGKEEADRVSERSNEEAGFVDTMLPRAALNKDTASAHKTYRERPGRMRSCSVLTRKQLDFSREASNEVAVSSSGVRLAETVKGENSDGADDAEGHARDDVADRVGDKERSEDVEQLEEHIYGEKDYGRGKGCAAKVVAQVNVNSRQAPAFQGTNSHAVSGSSVERLTDAASSPASNSYAPSTERRIELQQDVVKENDSQQKGDKGSDMISTVSATGVPVAVYIAEEDSKLIQLAEGEQVAKDGAAVPVLTEKLRARDDAAETVVGTEGALKRESVQQLESLTLPTGKHGQAGAGEPKPSQTTATDADEQRTSCGFRAVDGNTTARGDPSKAALYTERGAYEESSKYEASKSQEEAGKSQIEGCVLAAETGIERSRVCEDDVIAVVAHEKSGSSVREASGTNKSKSVPVSAGHFAPYMGEQKSTPPAKAAKLNGKKSPVVCARIRTDGEQLTSLSSQERGRSVVSSRRQLFEQRTPAASDRQSPPKPLCLKKRDPVQLQGEQVGKETTTAAAKRGVRCRDVVLRKGSLVERLREKYEGSSSSSSIGSLQTQPPATNSALSTTSICVEKGRPEPTWKRRQRVKLQAAQEAAGQSPGASADRGGSNLKDDLASSGAIDGTTGRQDFANSADVNNVVEGSLLTAGVAVTSETNLAPETYRSSASVKDLGYQMHRSVIKVYDGECSTVTSLKEKFERRKTQLKDEGQQQTQQPQNNVQQEQQQQQPLRHPAKAVTRLKAQYEQHRILEGNKPAVPCQGVTTTASTPVAAKTPSSLPKQKEHSSDSFINQQHGDSATASPTARTPVKCLKEQYQRLVTSNATASQRAAEPTTTAASTTVKSARELLGSVDIAGRYGKPYWMAKAERALKRDESRSSAEELSATESKRHDDMSAEAVAPGAMSTHEGAHQASCGDGSVTRILSTDASHGRQSSERTSSTRRGTVAKGDQGYSKESSASGKVKALESRTDRTRAYDASAVWKREAPVDVSLMEPRLRIDGCKAADRSAVRKAVHMETRQSAAGTRSEVRYSEEEQSPTVRARVSSKIGALASAIGPACINFGKAPPRRLLTRAEPEAETEETDLEIYGYSKAQEAIERRKRELKLPAKVTDCDRREQGDACCADTTETTCSTQSGGRVGCRVGDSKGPVHRTHPPTGEASRIVRDKKDENAGGTDNDGESSNNSVTEPKSSSRGSSGEVDESGWRCAETQRISSSVGRISNISGTEVRLSPSHADNRSSGSGTTRMLSTHSSEKLCGFSSRTGNGDAPSEHCPTQKRSPGSWKNDAVDFNKRNTNDVRIYTTAPKDPSDGEAHPRKNCVAFEFDQTSGSCFTSVKTSDCGIDAPLSCEPHIRYRHHVPYDERDESGGVSAEVDESVQGPGSGRIPPCKAECAAPAVEGKVNTEANEQSFSKVRNGQIQADGRKTVPARDEAQLSHVEDILRAEEQTAAGADVLAKVGLTDLTREEQLHTSREGLTDATGESSQDFTSLVGGTMQGFSSAASVKEQMEEVRGDEQKEPVVEGCVIHERVKANDTFASAREGYGSASVEAENSGGRAAAAVAPCSQGGTSYEEEEVKEKKRGDKLEEAVVEGGISFRRVEAGNTRAIVVQDYAETGNVEENGGRSGVAVTPRWPEKAAPCFDEEESYPKEYCPGAESGVDSL